MLIGWVEYCRDLCCVYVCPSQTHIAKYFDGGTAMFLGCGDKRPDVMTSECHWWINVDAKHMSLGCVRLGVVILSLI